MKAIFQFFKALGYLIGYIFLRFITDLYAVVLVSLTVIFEIILLVSIIGIPLLVRLREDSNWFKNPFRRAYWLIR